MFSFEPTRVFFVIVCFILNAILLFLSYLMYKNKNEYRRYIVWSILIGIFSITMYCFFILTDERHHFYAVLLDSLFFIGTDWLALCMFVFSLEYTGIGRKYKKLFLAILIPLCLADSVLLYANNYTHHMYDLILVSNKYIKYYWANNFHFWHYMHLALCYVMVGITFINFGVQTFKSPKVYKKKYSAIFFSYIVVIFVNFFCYTVNLPIDLSVVLYGVLAGFICFHTTYAFPHQLLNQTLEVVNETIDDGILYFDVDGNCVYANKVAKLIFSDEKGYSSKNAERYRKKREEYLLQEAESSEQVDSFTIENRERYYKSKYYREYIDQQIVGYSLKMIDVTTEVESLSRDEYIINHDELTGIYNRTGFLQKVDEFIKIHGTEGYYMITSDIRDFKLINQLFGEKIGDEVLMREAETLKQSAHYDTFYGRIGDDNFALYVRKEFFTEERFNKFIESVVQITESSLYQMHVDVGIYDPQGRPESAHVMVDKANMAISQMGADINKVYAFYDSTVMDQMLNEKNIQADFETAISSGQIKMYLQPIVDSNSKRLGAEALCRWEHPLRGFLLPSDFLGVLEKTGLIYQLDEYIWEKAAQKLHEWNEKGINDNYIAVNVSEKDFFFTDIYKTFTSLAEVYDINPQSLHLEISESVLMSDFSRAYKLLYKLKTFGFVITIDNFGSGFSSLNMLKDFNPQVIKIDMALLEDIEFQDRNRIILETIFEMSHALGIKVIGQGVDNKAKHDLLSQLNCNMFQGNALAKTVSVAEYEKGFLNTQKND